MSKQPQVELPPSDARKTFEANADNILYLSSVILRDINRLNLPIDKIQKLLPETSATVTRLSKETPQPTLTSALADLSTNVGNMQRFTDEIASIIAANARVHPFLFDWMLAMMVAFAETYLEHALLLLTAANPGFMKSGEKVISADDILAIEAQISLDVRWPELMTILQRCWTAQFLRDKPTQWIARLRRFGAKYPTRLDDNMKIVWNRRHEIIHARSSQPPAASGSNSAVIARYNKSKKALVDALATIYNFVTATDEFLVRFLKEHTKP